MRYFSLLLAYFAFAGATEGQTLARFTLKERFGISHPDQPVEFAYSGGKVDPQGARLIGPAGEEVPYQQLSNGDILIETSLPGSRIASAYRPTLMDVKADTIYIDLNLLTGAYPVSGDAVRFEGSDLPGGLAVAVNYFLKRLPSGYYQLSTKKDLSDTVDLTTNRAMYVRRPGFIVDPDDPKHSFYAKGHSYRTGDPILLKSTGALPAPFVTGQPYYVIRTSADTFQLAASRADATASSAIPLTTLGTGVFEATVEWTWTLEAGVPKAALAQPVQLNMTGNGVYELTNGLTGVRVLTAAGNAPPNKAPIQGVRLADNSWVATGPNYLYSTYTKNRATILTGYALDVVESGPLLTRLQARYTLNRPEYIYGDAHNLISADTGADTLTVAGNEYYWNGGTSIQFKSQGGTLPCGLVPNKLYWTLSRTYDQTADQSTLTLSESKNGTRIHLSCAPSGKTIVQETMNLAGPGSFIETISLYAGHKSVVIDDDSDAQLQYFLNVMDTGKLSPNQARWRGHASNSLDCGYSLQGSAKVAYVPYTDALVDASSKAAKDSSYGCDPNNIHFAPIWYMPSSGVSTGWYWELYDSAAPSSAPVIGYYIGRTSQYLTAIDMGPGVYTNPSHFASNNTPAVGITMHVGLRAPDGRSAQRGRREWAIYTGTKAELADPAAIQPVGIERNVMAGINLAHLTSYAYDYPDPPGGWPPPFQDPNVYLQFVARVQNDQAFQSSLYNSAPELRDLIAFWTGNTSSDAELVVSHLEQFAYHWLNIVVNQNGIFDSFWHYYQPGLIWEPLLTRTLVVLNSGAATPQQKARAKAVAALAASILWDDDYVPWDADNGDGTGNTNQGDQYSLYRAQNALMLFSQPEMAQNAAVAQQYAQYVYLSYLHPVSGAPRGSTHYHGAAMDPALANFLAMKSAGVKMDLFPQWNGYGRWLLSALTPPEPRFGNPRKVVSLGDGDTEAEAMPGMVASLLRQTDPVLSAQLQWGWNSQNTATTKTYGEFTAPSSLVIDENAPSKKPAMTSGFFPGYWSVLRHGFDTPNETVAWFVNGDFYSDHRHADSGQVTIYAHAAPLAIDWNPNLYYPEVPGALQHNRVLRESEIGQPWNSDNLSLTIGANWGSQTQTTFAGFNSSSDSESSFLSADGAAWTRGVTMIAANPSYPVIYVRDRFAGTDRTASKVLTWNLMAEGAVSTPSGQYTPVDRFNDAGTGTPNALPSNGPDYPLRSGLQRFSFTGQRWPSHPTSGIDWDLYLIPDGPQRFYIGSWGHNQHSSREVAEFQKANTLTFREIQRILRVQGTGGFSTLILPYRKGEAPARTVTQEDCGVRIAQGPETMCIAERSYQYANADTTILTTFDNQSAQFNGLSAAGGPLEVVFTQALVTVTASGAPGKRTFLVPGVWRMPAGIELSASGYSFDYAGGNPQVFTLTRPRAVRR